MLNYTGIRPIHYYLEFSGLATYMETHPKSLEHFYEETYTTHFILNLLNNTSMVYSDVSVDSIT